MTADVVRTSENAFLKSPSSKPKVEIVGRNCCLDVVERDRGKK